jgi:hypothetical protein
VQAGRLCAKRPEKVMFALWASDAVRFANNDVLRLCRKMM